MDREAARRGGGQIGPTYFEILTAAAFLLFARTKIDLAVLEVGLGGRLDATNVCTPAVSVITSISFDHTRQLGDTLAAIAGEKAGIAKRGVPLVSGVTADEPRQVIRQVCRRRRCRLLELGVHFDFDYRPPAHLEEADAAGTMDFRWRKRRPGPWSKAIATSAWAWPGGTRRPTWRWPWPPWASCSRPAGTSPRRRSAVVWPPWRGRRGWKWRPGDRPSCSTAPITRPRWRP